MDLCNRLVTTFLHGSLYTMSMSTRHFIANRRPGATEGKWGTRARFLSLEGNSWRVPSAAHMQYFMIYRRVYNIMVEEFRKMHYGRILHVKNHIYIYIRRAVAPRDFWWRRGMSCADQRSVNNVTARVHYYITPYPDDGFQWLCNCKINSLVLS